MAKDMSVEELARSVGAIHYSPAPLRAVRGLSFTYEQLEAFVALLSHEAKPVAQPDAERYRAYRRFQVALQNALHGEGSTDEATFDAEVDRLLSSESMRDNIISAAQEQRDQWCNGMAECLSCHWKWAAVWPLNAGPLECKKCGSTDTIRELA